MTIIAWALARPTLLRVALGAVIAIAVAASVLWVYLAGRHDGRTAIEAAQDRRAVENVEVRREVEEDVRGGGDGRSAAERLRDGWSRPD